MTQAPDKQTTKHRAGPLAGVRCFISRAWWRAHRRRWRTDDILRGVLGLSTERIAELRATTIAA